MATMNLTTKAGPSLGQVIEAGQFLCESSCPIILLQHGLKKPIAGPDGSWLTLSEPDEVEASVKALGFVPNIGVVLAPKMDSKVVVVDVDGGAALPQLRELGISSGDGSWVARTGRSGWHIYFWHPPELPDRRVKAAGLPVDLLVNGFAVAPPSDTRLEPDGGGPYHWIAGKSPVDIPSSLLPEPPEALMDWWRSLSEEGRQEGRSQGGKAWQLLKAPIPEHTRHNTLLRIAGWLKLYHPLSVVEALLVAVNDARCSPPLPGEEVKAIVWSLARYSLPGPVGHPKAIIPSFFRGEAHND